MSSTATITEKTTSEKLIELGNMLGRAGEMHFARIKLAKEIIEDKDWLVSNFAGDEYRAGEVLEENYLSDLCGAINFWRLLKVYEAFPDIEEWRKNKFNFTAMSAQLDEKNAKSKEKGTRWSVSQKEYEDLNTEKNQFKKMYEVKKVEVEKQTKDIIDKDARIKELERQVIDLEKENARLEGKVAELERLLSGFTQKASA